MSHFQHILISLVNTKTDQLSPFLAVARTKSSKTSLAPQIASELGLFDHCKILTSNLKALKALSLHTRIFMTYITFLSL